MARFGLGHYIGFGDLGFASTGVNTDIKAWFRGYDGADQMQFARDIVEVKDFTVWDDDYNVLFGGQRHVTGSVTLQGTFGYMQNILRHITGDNETVVGSPGAPYTYTLSPLGFNDTNHHVLGGTPLGFVVECYRGQGSNSVFYQGCIVTSSEWRFEAGGVMEVTLNFIGRGFSISAKSTPTFKNDIMVCASGQSANLFTLDNTVRIARSVSFTIDHKLEERRDITDVETLLPYPGGKREVMVTAEIETDDDTALSDLDAPKANRYSTNSIKLEQQGASTRYLQFNFPELVVQSPAETRVSSLGVLTTSLSLKAFSNGSTPTYNVVLVNDDANYV